MKIHIKRNISLNNVAFAFILCIVLLNGYFDGAAVGFAWSAPMWNIGIVVMFAAILLEYLLHRRLDKRSLNILIIGGIIFISFLAVSYIWGNDRGFAKRNLMRLVKVVVVEMSIMMLAANQRYNFFGCLKKCFWLFNFWGILNMVVLTIQINVKGFMMQPEWLSMNSYYEDLCAGLFGYNGTHRLSIYMTFLFLYNLYIAEFETEKKIKKKMMYFYNFILLAWHFLLSTKNDNMAIYMLTVIFFAAYVFLNIHWKNHSFSVNIVKWSKYIWIGLFVSGLAFVVPVTREFIMDDIIKRIMKFTTVTSLTGFGSTERLSILLYSFGNRFGYGIGKGIGFYPFGGDMETNAVMGFHHFGLSSMSSMIYLMGVWFYLFFVIWTSKIYQSMCRRNDRTLFAVILLLMLFLTFYTTNLTSTPMSVYLMLLFAVFCMMEEGIRKNNSLRRKQAEK